MLDVMIDINNLQNTYQQALITLICVGWVKMCNSSVKYVAI